MTLKVSPIFSLADTFEHTVKEVDTFEDLGASHDGQHIGLFFRKLVQTELHIDYRNPFPLNRFCKLYNFVNGRGSIYGHLFCVTDPSKMSLQQHRIIVTCNKLERYDYVQVPINSDKQKFLLFKTSTGSILAISGSADSPYVIKEPL